MNKCTERVYNGIIKENPTFILMLGMCPTLATTTSAINGLGMGLSTTMVLMFSNLLISALRNIIPDRVRIPAFIVIVASLVTIVQLLIQGYVPSLYDSLGIYIPLIVVNCIILGRAESYASKNGPAESFFDGVGMGLGFTAALTAIGLCRELLGSGAVFGHVIIPEEFHISIFVLAPGAFFVLAMLTAVQNKLKLPSATNGDAPKSALACGGNCLACTGCGSSANHMILAEKKAEEAAKAAAAKKAAAEKALAAKKAAEEAKAAEASKDGKES
ncbi:MAG: electron transport complex subunit E [Lachnospiraceae bacterium]|jgi:electron transport complex protein RnfE|nr:electron transport complex subunit E [Lachnospiraceae bacterium]NBJ81302.1 electron transport complex subunit E [bacterium 1XD42-76]NBK04745.1 electron transport complex subunit E [bacterium 1XD42-94]